MSTLLTTFSYNAWYGYATGDLIRTPLHEIEDGHLDRVLKIWRGLDQQYKPTYENRARYRELVEEATRRMEGDLSIITGSPWDAAVFNAETWSGHWEDDHGYWIIINGSGQSFDIYQSGQPRAKIHSVTVSPDFNTLKFQEGDQWLHTLTLKNKYEASYDWFDLKQRTVSETRPVYKLIRATEEQKRMTELGGAANRNQLNHSATNKPSVAK